MNILSFINYGSVLFFGIVLSLTFADIEISKNKKQYAFVLSTFGVLQTIGYLLLGDEVLYKLYPFLIHIPLFLLLKYHYRKHTYIAGIAVLSAYLFCTPRKWIGTAISCIWSYNSDVSNLVQIVITIPLLVIIAKLVSPYVSRLKYENDKVLRNFILVPLIYYVIEYIITVYSNLLYSGGAAVVEFMDSAIVTVYFIFSIIHLKTLYEKREIEIEHAVLTAMADNFYKEIESLRNSEKQSAIFRHDLRHHMNYLNACIAENKLQDATNYIHQTCKDIENTKVIEYSVNEPINLIVSSYVTKAKAKGITIDVKISATEFNKFQITDLCTLLANALENAINACEKVNNDNVRHIKLNMFEKHNRLCLEVSNSYDIEPSFECGVPITHKKGHGIGVKSIIYVVEKYQGIYIFSAKDKEFTFKMTI